MIQHYKMMDNLDVDMINFGICYINFCNCNFIVQYIIVVESINYLMIQIAKILVYSVTTNFMDYYFHHSRDAVLEASKYDQSWQIQNVNMNQLNRIIRNISSKRNLVFPIKSLTNCCFHYNCLDIFLSPASISLHVILFVLDLHPSSKSL